MFFGQFTHFTKPHLTPSSVDHRSQSSHRNKTDLGPVAGTVKTDPGPFEESVKTDPGAVAETVKRDPGPVAETVVTLPEVLIPIRYLGKILWPNADCLIFVLKTDEQLTISDSSENL